MKSPNRHFLPAVDHLRGFAAVLVLYYHGFYQLQGSGKFGIELNASGGWPLAKNALISLVMEGHTAVGLFLVLSGFILTYGSLGKHLELGRFFRNRAYRILPLIIFVMVIGMSLGKASFSFLGFLQRLFLLGNYVGAVDLPPWTDVMWSVAVESQLYLVFPIIHLYLSNGKTWPIYRLLFLGLAFRFAGLLLGATSMDVTASVLGRADQFLIGALIAYWLRDGRSRVALKWLFPVSVGAVLALTFAFNRAGGWPVDHNWRIVWPLVEGATWGFLLACYLQVAHFLPMLVSRALEFLGKISYSFYMMHFPVVLIAARYFFYFNSSRLGGATSIFLSITLLFLPIVTALSWLTYESVERPFLDMRKRYVSPGRAASEAA